MIFVSYAQAARDIREWSNRLPQDLICVVGVPRSGSFIGSALAHHRNICYADIHQIIAKDFPWAHGHRRTIPSLKRGRVLIVDDTIWMGRTREQVMSVLPMPPEGVTFEYAGLYCNAEMVNLAPLSGRVVPHIRHSFEWNYFHDIHAKRLATDLDGVICEDWGTTWKGTVADESTDRYLEFLQNTRPIRIPSGRIEAIVTARLEKYRPQTEAWLRRHRIHYHRLLMSPYGSPQERGNKTIETKIKQLQSLGGAIWAYVDDHRGICEAVAKKTTLTVVNGPTSDVWNSESMGAWINERTDESGPRQLDRSAKAAKKFERQRKIN